jgi:hypothetical protein
MSPLLVIGLVPFVPLAIQLAFSLGRGQIRMRGGSVIRRDENPRRYWTMIAAHAPILTVSFLLIYLGLFGNKPT